MDKAIRIIYDEHRSLSAVLSALKSLAQMAREGELKPDFALLRAMVYYIFAFPERQHHPKEDTHLFARLLMRDPAARMLVNELQAEHVKGARLVQDLERALLEYEQTWPKGGDRFAALAQDYAQFHWNHMRREENELLPMAQKSLTSEDWASIEEAFAGNSDPIADLREKDLSALYQRILNLAPAPVGLGERWAKAR
jgi:hemerythrin-like domain-containing protein